MNAVATLGVAQKRLGKLEEAMKTLNRALALSPNDHEILNNIGELLYQQGSYEKAAESCLKALQVKGDGK